MNGLVALQVHGDTREEEEEHLLVEEESDVDGKPTEEGHSLSSTLQREATPATSEDHGSQHEPRSPRLQVSTDNGGGHAHY